MSNSEDLKKQAKEIRGMYRGTKNPALREMLRKQYQEIDKALERENVSPPDIATARTLEKDNSNGCPEPQVINYQCPACRNVMAIPGQYVGQKGKCEQCGARFNVGAPPNAVPPPIPPPTIKGNALKTTSPHGGKNPAIAFCIGLLLLIIGGASILGGFSTYAEGYNKLGYNVLDSLSPSDMNKISEGEYKYNEALVKLELAQENAFRSKSGDKFDYGRKIYSLKNGQSLQMYGRKLYIGGFFLMLLSCPAFAYALYGLTKRKVS